MTEALFKTKWRRGALVAFGVLVIATVWAFAFDPKQRFVPPPADEYAAMNVRRYDIRPLVINVPIEQGWSYPPKPGQDERTTELIRGTVKLFQDIVDSPSWIENGGTARLRIDEGWLVVEQTPANQRVVVRLLEQLNETRSLPVVEFVQRRMERQ